jgi:hypothetical protein
MSHYHAEVWIDKKPEDQQDLEDIIKDVMEPYQQGYAYSESFWDWYEIGGRWSGEHKTDNDPFEDCTPIEDIKPDQTCKTFLTVDGDIYHKQLWTGDNFIDNPDFDGLVIPKLDSMLLPGGYLVTVDYHI